MVFGVFSNCGNGVDWVIFIELLECVCADLVGVVFLGEGDF